MAMELYIDRAWKKKGYTISRLYIDGKRFGDGKNWCCALEDEDRGLTSDMTVDEILGIKKYGETAIPRGRYEIEVTWSPKFGRYLPHVIAVKGFTGIRLHSGNSNKDTLGCILFGVNDVVGMVHNSRYWCNLVQAKIEEALKRKEKVFIQVG